MQLRSPMWWRLLLVCSGTMYACLLMHTASKVNFAVNAGLAFLVMLYLVFRRALAESFLKAKYRWEYPVAALLVLTAIYQEKSWFFTNCKVWLMKAFTLLRLPAADLLLRLTPWAVALLALPAAFCYMLWFLDFMAGLALRLWKEIDYVDRIYFVSAGILFALMILFTYLCTQAFYGANVNGIRYDYDLIYSADSGNLVSLDVFRNIGAAQNDTRQPLYGLFSMPFAQAAWLITLPLFFLQNSYITVLQILQLLLFLTAVLMLAKLLRVSGAEKVAFYLLISCSYPMLIFSLTVEQYLMAVFWVILLVYNRSASPAGELFFISATGSLLTSGVLFPLVTWDRSFRRFVKNSFQLCGAFFAVLILCGRLTVLLELGDSLALYGHYSGADVPAINKLMQYVNFVGATLFAPNSQVDNFTYRYHISFQMVPVTSWSIVGLLVLLAACIGVVVSRKDAFTRICGAWILFSFVLLGLVGWGTIDNGLFLYALYFGWAYVAMVFRAFDCIPTRWRYLKLGGLFALAAVMAVVNVNVLRDAIVFATQFYPRLG